MMFLNNIISEEEFKEKIQFLDRDLMTMDQLYVFKAEPRTIVMRDYMNEIYLEDRKKTTIEQVTKLGYGIDEFLPIIKNNMNDSTELVCYDTTDYTEMDTSIIIANKMLQGMENRIVKVKK